MNRFICRQLLSLAMVTFAALNGEAAQARLFCLSLRFQTATTKPFGETYTLDLSTDQSSSTPNGELAPLFQANSYTHGSAFRLQDPILVEDITGVIAFDVPAADDINSNGVPDFFEVSQSVGATTRGAFQTAIDEGMVTATWSRAAGSGSGACKLTLEGGTFGQLPDFTHTFDIFEFAGRLDYTPGSNTVTGTIQLMQTSASTNLLGGAISFAKVETNRFNELVLQPGFWTNQAGQSLSYTNDLYERDLGVKTNYYGLVEFDDGNLETSAPDYFTWALSIDDVSDRNGNGIPDFSDDPVSVAFSGPRLEIRKLDTGLLLNINGDTGKLYELQEISSLNQTNWTKALSLTLTNSSQTVELPLPKESTTFWRLRVP